MTDSTTTNLGLTLPTVGADNNAWGGILNTDLTSLDALWAAIGNVAFGTAATKTVGTATGNVPLFSSANTLAVSVTGNAATATTATTASTANAVAAGSVAPAGLSTGHPTWDTSSNLSATGNLSLAAGVIVDEVITSTINRWIDTANGTRFSYNRSTGFLYYLVGGTIMFHVDPSGNAVFKGTVTQNGSP